MVHTVRHKNASTEAEDPEQTVTRPCTPAPKQWTLYGLLARARTLPENSIIAYTDFTYVKLMLQDWPKYETDVLEGHTGPEETTPCTTVPNGDISALPELIQNTALKHALEDSYDPAMVNAILAHHSWTTEQRLHLHSASKDAREWHPIGPPALEVSLQRMQPQGRV